MTKPKPKTGKPTYEELAKENDVLWDRVDYLVNACRVIVELEDDLNAPRSFLVEQARTARQMYQKLFPLAARLDSKRGKGKP